MRLYPPAWLIHREPLIEDELGGYRVRPGTLVLISPYLLHRNTAFWEDPEVFDPDRFEPALSAVRPRFAYLPFGGGPRQCIGNEFAMMEAVLILCTFLQRYRLQLVSHERIEPEPMVTLRAKAGIWMTARKRPAAPARGPAVRPAEQAMHPPQA
jgi:enediyne biosynthesis protein E7